jgi:hypothetical protein
MAFQYLMNAFIWAALLGCHASTIQVLDENGRAHANILVIVKSLDGKGEVGRYLTDKYGRTPPVQLGDGLYRLIGVCPDDMCGSAVKEYLLPTQAPLILTVSSNPRFSTIRIVDETEKPFPDVLVVIKAASATGEIEIARYLTDANGNIPPLFLEPRTYHITATCPYGLCRTITREVFGKSSASEIVLKVPPVSSDVNGQIVGAPKLHLILESSTGERVKDTQILIRDPEAKWETWYNTGKDGSVTVDLPTEPSVLVIRSNQTLYDYEISSKCPVARNEERKPTICVQSNEHGLANATVKLK